MRDVKGEKKLPAIILDMKPKLYNLLSDLSFPMTLRSRKYDEIVDLALKHLSSSPNEICYCIEFRKCFPLENETVQGFYTRLKKKKNLRLTALSQVTN